MTIKQHLRTTYRRSRGLIATVRQRGDAAYCPCCDSWQRSFRDLVMPDRQCWICGSLERHRLVAILFSLRPELTRPGRDVLHIAPEAMLATRLKRHARSYVGGDLTAEFGSARIDVLDLQFGDGSFDVVVCNHVLEHVPDDRRAMREVRRVLRPDGWAMLLVPDVQLPHTAETPDIDDPDEMLRLYGQRDHVRRYGWDYLDRLRDSGLEPEVIRLGGLITPATASVCRLLKFGEIEPLFLARVATP